MSDSYSYNNDSYYEDSLEEISYNNKEGGKSTEQKWTTFSHNGVMFFPPYEPHKIPLLYGGIEIFLKDNSEEYATIYSKYTGTEYLNNKKFKKNFFNDWKKILKKDGHGEIIDFDKCDFTLMYDYLLRRKNEKAELTPEDKDSIKEIKEKEEKKYKYAHVDGKKQEIGNYKLENPSIFMGRGICNPSSGHIKNRILPEDITINIDKTSPVPKLPNFYKNHHWGKIIHDNTLEWLASWYDDITKKTKYVFLGHKSDFKAKSDEYKFQLAQKLSKNISEIRRINNLNIIDKSNDKKIKQLATALYILDTQSLRIGNEVSEDKSETFGVSSLLVKHIDLSDENFLKLDFLGKDSIRYKRNVSIDPDVYDNLLLFVKNKSKNDELFDLINSNDLNEYIKQLTGMDNISAKCIRTMNASMLFQLELLKIDEKFKNYNKSDREDQFKNAYLKANLLVSILCNHQKKISKTFSEQIKKMDTQIKDLKLKKDLIKDNKTKIKKIGDKIRILKNKKNMKEEMQNFSLSTSQLNYLHPAITYSFVKRNKLNIDDYFTQNLQNRFFWCADVVGNWLF
jgi:DNA topoisomerase-1